MFFIATERDILIPCFFGEGPVPGIDLDGEEQLTISIETDLGEVRTILALEPPGCGLEVSHELVGAAAYDMIEWSSDGSAASYVWSKAREGEFDEGKLFRLHIQAHPAPPADGEEKKKKRPVLINIKPIEDQPVEFGEPGDEPEVGLRIVHRRALEFALLDNDAFRLRERPGAFRIAARGAGCAIPARLSTPEGSPGRPFTVDLDGTERPWRRGPRGGWQTTLAACEDRRVVVRDATGGVLGELALDYCTPRRQPVRALFIDALTTSSQGTHNTRQIIAALARRYDLSGRITLMGGDTTRETVRSALRKLAERVGPDEAVLLYYVGHGGACRLEPSSTIPPSWRRRRWAFISPGAVEPEDISAEDALYVDEILHELRERVLSKSRNVTVVFDCCYAGSMLSQLLPIIPVPAPLVALASEGYDESAPSEGIVVVQSSEDASNSYFNPKQGPLMTGELAATVSAFAGPLRAPWASILRQVRARLRGQSAQLPRVVGPTGRYPFSLERVDVSTRMDCTVAAGVLSVNCGSVHGLATKDELELVDPAGGSVWSAVIGAEVGLLHAIVEPKDNAARRASLGYDAYLVRSANPVTVAISATADAGAGAVDRARAVIEAIPELVVGGEGSTHTVCVSREGCRVTAPGREPSAVSKTSSELHAILLGLIRAQRFGDFITANQGEDGASDAKPKRLRLRVQQSDDTWTPLDQVQRVPARARLEIERNPAAEACFEDELFTHYYAMVLELDTHGRLRSLHAPFEIDHKSHRADVGVWRPQTGCLYLVTSEAYPEVTLLEPPATDARGDDHFYPLVDPREFSRKTFVEFTKVEVEVDAPIGEVEEGEVEDTGRDAVPVRLDPASTRLIYRSQQVRHHLRAWLQDESFVPGSRVSAEQAHALRAAFDGLDRQLEDRERKLARAASSSRRGLRNDLEQELLEVTLRRDMVQRVIDQRRDRTTLTALQTADRCAVAGYQAGLGGEDQRPPALPPLVILESHRSLAFTNPNFRLRTPSLITAGTRRRLSVPFLSLPPSHLHAIWMLPVLQHEVGHYLGHDLGHDGFTPILPKRDSETWARWLPELASDLWGFILGGEGFVRALTANFDAQTGPTWELDLDHPPPSVRLRFLAGAMREANLEGPHHAETHARIEAFDNGDMPAAVAEYVAGAERLASEMLRSTHPNTRKPLIDTVDIALEAQRTRALVELLCAGAKPEQLVAQLDSTGSCIRIIPSAAQLALSSPEVDLHDLHERCIAAIQSSRQSEWILTRRDLNFLSEVESFRATDVVEVSGRRWKVPPVERMRNSSRMSFVGVSHHQLLTRLERAYALRGHDPWDSIELFFLDESLHHWFYDDVTLANLAPMSTIITDIAALLSSGACKEWAIYTYERPQLFATFFDADEPHGLIHTSANIWGGEIGAAPGLDIVRGTNPSRRYLALVDGLEALRRLPDTRVFSPGSAHARVR